MNIFQRNRSIIFLLLLISVWNKSKVEGNEERSGIEFEEKPEYTNKVQGIHSRILLKRILSDVLARCAFRSKRTSTSTTTSSTTARSSIQIESEKITDWGTWSNPTFCDINTYAIGFNSKVEVNQSSGDDTALNSIKLICSNSKEINSGEGKWGLWDTNVFCPAGTFLNGFKIKVESPQGGGNADDTATNAVRMICSDGTVLNNNNEAIWGSWYGPFLCPDKKFICGFKQQIEPDQQSGDDTALNNVAFYCC